MPAEKGIFLDVLPRFDMAALALILDKVMAAFKKTGAAMGASFGAEAEKRLVALEAQVVKSRNAMTDADIRAERAKHAAEVASARYSEVLRMENAAESTLLRAKYAKIDAMRLETARMRDLEAANRVLAKSEEAHAAAAAATTVTVSNLTKVLNVAGLAATGVFLFSVAKAGNAAGDFQEKMARLVASAGESTANLSTVSQGLMSVASQTGYSAQELGDAMYLVEKAGYRGAQGITVMRAAAQLARAENTSLDEVIQGLTTTMHDFHIPTDQAAVVASKMNVAVGEAKSNLRDFSAALSSVEPTAAIAKMRLEEVYAAMAQITQSGITPQRAGENLNNMLEHLINIPMTQRNAMNKFGIDPDKVKEALGDPNVGLIGILDTVQKKIKDQMTPEGKVWVDTYFQSASAARSLNNQLEELKRNANVSDQAKAMAENLVSGRIGKKEFVMGSRSDVPVADQAKLQTILNTYSRSQDFSQNLKQMKSQEETLAQAYKEIFGTDAAFRVAAQISGSEEALDDYAKKVLELKMTTAEADGTVKGFNVTQETLNARMRDAKASFENATIQLGNAFLPVLTAVANGLGVLARFLERHPGLMLGVTLAIGAMSAAWIVWKGLVVGSAIIEAIGGMIAKFGLLQASVGLTISELMGIVPAATAGETAVVQAAAVETGAIAEVGGAAVVASGEVAGIGGAAVVAESGVAAATAAMDAELAGVAASANAAKFSILGLLGVVSVLPAVGYEVKKLTDWNQPGLGDKTADEIDKPGIPWYQKLYNSAIEWAGGDPATQNPDNARSAEDRQKAHDQKTGQSDQDKLKGQAEQAQAIAEIQKGLLPENKFTKAEDYARALMGLKGMSIQDAIKAARERFGTDAELTPSIADSTVPTPDPSAFEGGGGGGGGKGGKGASGTKDDPVYTMPLPEGGIGVGGTGSGKGSDNIGDTYDPFQEAGRGGFTLPNLAKLAATFFTNLALGNPYGKLQAAKKGESANNPLYTLDVGDGTVSGTKGQFQEWIKAINAQQAAQKYEAAVSKYGQDSPEARAAYGRVLTANAALQSQQLKNGSGGAGAPYAPGKQGIANMILQSALNRGYSMEEATHILAYSIGESGLDPKISGGNQGGDEVIGLFQEKSAFAGGASVAQRQNPQFNIDAYLNRLEANRHLPIDQALPATSVGGPLATGPGAQPQAWGPLLSQARNYAGNYGGAAPAAPQAPGGIGAAGAGVNPGATKLPSALIGGAGNAQAPLGGPAALQSQYPRGLGGGQSMGQVPRPAAVTDAPSTDTSQQLSGGSGGGGFGISGGVLGTALSAAGAAASMGLNAIAPGAGAAGDIMTKEANRFVGYVGQLAGIGMEGLLETFMLNDSALSDPSKSLFGKIALGIAGAHPSAPNSAGQTAEPLKPQEPQQQQPSNQPAAPLVHIENMTNNNTNGENLGKDLNRQMMAVQNGAPG